MDYEKQFEDVRKAGKAERITAQRFVFKEGDTLTGLYMGRDLIKATKKGMTDSYSYRFDTNDGPVTCFISSAFDKQHGESLTEGHLYRILFKGKVPISEGRTLKIFDVYDGGPLPSASEVEVEV